MKATAPYNELTVRAATLLPLSKPAVGKGTIAVGGGFVWISTRPAPIPRTNSLHGKFKVEMTEYSTIRFGSGSLWMSGGAVRRIKPPE